MDELLTSTARCAWTQCPTTRSTHCGSSRSNQADLFGYSMGAGVALNIAIRRPEIVRRLALASVTYDMDGFHPRLLEGLSQLQPEWLDGTPWQREYVEVAPQPEAFASLVSRVKEMNANLGGWPAERIQAISAPTLLIVGDSDIVRLDHAVEMFRLRSGGINGETPQGLPKSRLAVLPGTSHSMVPSRADLLLSTLTSFLEA